MVWGGIMVRIFITSGSGGWGRSRVMFSAAFFFTYSYKVKHTRTHEPDFHLTYSRKHKSAHVF